MSTEVNLNYYRQRVTITSQIVTNKYIYFDYTPYDDVAFYKNGILQPSTLYHILFDGDSGKYSINWQITSLVLNVGDVVYIDYNKLNTGESAYVLNDVLQICSCCSFNFTDFDLFILFCFFFVLFFISFI